MGKGGKDDARALKGVAGVHGHAIVDDENIALLPLEGNAVLLHEGGHGLCVGVCMCVGMCW